MAKLVILVFIALFINVKSDTTLQQIVKFKLQNVLDFIEENYEEFHFDGLFGVTFAHAFLIKSLELPIQNHVRLHINDLIKKCKRIHDKIYPSLPNNPEYMITFRNNLLDAEKWNKILSNRFTIGGINYLGYYKNWTVDTIIQNKRAIYKGVKSDVCLREILELSQRSKQCYVSHICEEMMLDENRVDTGYLLTHRLLYLQIIKLQGCILPEKFWPVSEYTKIYCSFIYKEAMTSDRLNFPHYDIFLEQVVLCGMEGFAEFLNSKWLNRIMQWQNLEGCYESVKQNITRRTSFQVGFGCSDHTTGLGAAALALHLRYLLNIYVYQM